MQHVLAGLVFFTEGVEGILNSFMLEKMMDLAEGQIVSNFGLFATSLNFLEY